MIVKRSVCSLALLFSAFSFLFSQAPSITSVTPASGVPGAVVTIAGNNFSAASASDVVYFSGVKAAVSSASPTQLKVVVPVGASFGPVSVTVTSTGLTASSAIPFIPTFPGGVALSSSGFFPKMDFVTGDLPYGVAIGDLDGDGKPDFVVTNNADSSISIFRNTGTGDSLSTSTFAPPVILTTGRGPWGIAVADIDGDGKLDIVVSNGNGGTISVFRNAGSSGSITASSFAPRVDFATGGGGGGGYGIAIADLDGDGKPDVVVTNHFANSISILRNTSGIGSVAFAATVDLSTGAIPYGVAVGDLDGDGKPDIVVANSGIDSLSIFRNTSSSGSISAASFAPKISLPASGTPDAVALVDVNADGKPEIVSANTSDSTLSVFQNNSTSGSLSFAAAVDFKLNSAPNSIALGDFNGDGLPDIATSNNGNTVSVFQNMSGSGNAIAASSLGGEKDFSIASSPFGLAIGDLNGDGRPDLITASSQTNTASVFLSDNGIPSIAVGKSPIGFGFVPLHDSSSIDVEVKDVSANRLIIDTIYANRNKLTFSVTQGNITDSLKLTMLFRADSIGFYADTVFIKSNALTPLIMLPVSAKVYSLPGKPAAVSVTPSGWSNAQSFSISWTNSLAGMLPIGKIWYSIDTLPRNAASAQSQAAANTSASLPMSLVGKDTVYFFLEDSLGNKNQDSVASVVIKFDNNGPAIVHNNAALDTIFVQADGSLSGIPPIAASSSEPANESGVMSFNLLYRRLDEQAWTTVSFANDSAAIPSTSFIKNGTAVGAVYRIQAIDSAGNISLSNLYSFDIRYSNDLTVTDFTTLPTVHSLSLPAGQEVKAYRLLSVPYIPEDQRPSSFVDQSFGPSDANGVAYVNWRMVRWFNGAWSDYGTYKDLPVVVPGSGFMMVTENAGKSAALARPKLIRADNMLYNGIALDQGWNLLGNPFLVDVPFDRLIFQGGTPLAHYYFSGTGTQGGWEGSGSDVDTMRSWQGLAVEVDTACVVKFDLAGVILPPAAGMIKKGAKLPVKADPKLNAKEWTLGIDAVRDDINMSCLGAEVGMKANAQKGVDPSDRFQAPFIGGSNILLGMESAAGMLMKDMRPVSSEGDVWDVTVKTGDALAKSQLKFGSTEAIVNQGFGVIAVDPAKGLAYDLTKQKSIVVTSGSDGEGMVRLIVGTSSFIDKNLDGVALIPNEPNLFNNYPNPFNPATVIRYAVPSSMPSARVQLRVYNILGQQIRTLVDGSVAPGFYEASFDGHGLASGTYFYRISITGGGASYHNVKKMLLIK